MPLSSLRLYFNILMHHDEFATNGGQSMIKKCFSARAYGKTKGLLHAR